MKKTEKTIHQLKREVLLAYLSKKTPGISDSAKEAFELRYQEARSHLAKAFEQNPTGETK